MTDKIQQARREIFEAWTKSEHGNLSRRQDASTSTTLLTAHGLDLMPR